MMKEVLATPGILVAVGGAFAAGYFVSNYNHLKNTPEAVINKMENVKAEAKAQENSAIKAKKEAELALSRLKSTKKQYQDEIRPELEKIIRRDLQTYISEADKKYESARKEREMADVKLELARLKDRTSGSTDIFKVMYGGTN